MRLVTRKVFAPPGQPAAQSEQQAAASRRQAHHRDLTALIAPNGSEINDPVGTADHIEVVNDHPHNSRPNPANAAALLRHEEAATSAAGALDADSSVSDATTPPGTADTEEKPLPEYLSVLQRTDC